jgi:phosphatidylinositol transfer protein SFH5
MSDAPLTMTSNLVLSETYNQFVKTLKWRKEFKPLEAATEKHDSVYDTVGYVTGKDKKGRLVTYNLYGGLDNDAVPSTNTIGL